jgi:hypothetical protein
VYGIWLSALNRREAGYRALNRREADELIMVYGMVECAQSPRGWI